MQEKIQEAIDELDEDILENIANRKFEDCDISEITSLLKIDNQTIDSLEIYTYIKEQYTSMCEWCNKDKALYDIHIQCGERVCKQCLSLSEQKQKHLIKSEKKVA